MPADGGKFESRERDRQSGAVILLISYTSTTMQLFAQSGEGENERIEEQAKFGRRMSPKYLMFVFLTIPLQRCLEYRSS